MWFSDATRRHKFLRALAQERLGGPIVGNLLAALQSGVLRPDMVRDLVERSMEVTAPTRRDAAIKVVQTPGATFQFQGPAIASPDDGNVELIALRQVIGVRWAIQQQVGTPGAADVPLRDDAMRVYLSEQKQKAQARVEAETPLGEAHDPVRTPVLKLFHSGYPAWYARREGDFDVLLEAARHGARSGADPAHAVKLLRYLGLPIESTQTWMMIAFAPASMHGLHRPTVMEGVDAPFFKHAACRADNDDDWGRTADLRDLLNSPPPPTLLDGAVEAVGRPLTVLEMTDCFVFPTLPIDLEPSDEDLHPVYDQGLLRLVVPKAADWAEVAARLAKLA